MHHGTESAKQSKEYPEEVRRLAVLEEKRKGLEEFSRKLECMDALEKNEEAAVANELSFTKKRSLLKLADLIGLHTTQVNKIKEEIFHAAQAAPKELRLLRPSLVAQEVAGKSSRLEEMVQELPRKLKEVEGEFKKEEEVIWQHRENFDKEIAQSKQQVSAQALRAAHDVLEGYNKEWHRYFEELGVCEDKLRDISSLEKQEESKSNKKKCDITKLWALEQLNEYAVIHSDSRVYKCKFQLVKGDGSAIDDPNKGSIWGYQYKVEAISQGLSGKISLRLWVPLSEEGRVLLGVGDEGRVPIKAALDSLAQHFDLLPSEETASHPGDSSGLPAKHRRENFQEHRERLAKEEQEKEGAKQVRQKEIKDLQEERKKLSQELQKLDLDNKLKGARITKERLESKIKELKSKSEEIGRKIEKIECKKGNLGVELAQGIVKKLNEIIKTYYSPNYEFNIASYDPKRGGYILNIQSKKLGEYDKEGVISRSPCLKFVESSHNSSDISPRVTMYRDGKKYELSLSPEGGGVDKEGVKALLVKLGLPPFLSKGEPSIPTVTEASKNKPSIPTVTEASKNKPSTSLGAIENIEDMQLARREVVRLNEKIKKYCGLDYEFNISRYDSNRGGYILNIPSERLDEDAKKEFISRSPCLKFVKSPHNPSDIFSNVTMYCGGEEHDIFLSKDGIETLLTSLSLRLSKDGPTLESTQANKSQTPRIIFTGVSEDKLSTSLESIAEGEAGPSTSLAPETSRQVSLGIPSNRLNGRVRGGPSRT